MIQEDILVLNVLIGSPRIGAPVSVSLSDLSVPCSLQGFAQTVTQTITQTLSQPKGFRKLDETVPRLSLPDGKTKQKAVEFPMPLERDNEEERLARIEHLLDVARAAHEMAQEAHEDAERRFIDAQRRLTTTKATLGRVEDRLKRIRQKTDQLRHK